MANSSEPANTNQPNLIDESIDITASSGKNFWIDQGFTWLVYVFAALTVAVLFWMSWIVFQKALPAIKKFGLGFLWNQQWDTGNLVLVPYRTFTALWLAARSPCYSPYQ